MRVQQIKYLRAVLKEIAARDLGIKTSANSDAMGLAWHRLHEAYYWLRRLQQTVRRIRLRIETQAQRQQRSVTVHTANASPCEAMASSRTPLLATHVAVRDRPCVGPLKRQHPVA
jgi:hypothetical protein